MLEFQPCNYHSGRTGWVGSDSAGFITLGFAALQKQKGVKLGSGHGWKKREEEQRRGAMWMKE